MRGFLTIGYCFPYYFLEIFLWGGGQGFDGGDKVVMGIPPSPPPLGKTLNSVKRLQPHGTSRTKPYGKFKRSGNDIFVTSNIRLFLEFTTNILSGKFVLDVSIFFKSRIFVAMDENCFNNIYSFSYLFFFFILYIYFILFYIILYIYFFSSSSQKLFNHVPSINL